MVIMFGRGFDSRQLHKRFSQLGKNENGNRNDYRFFYAYNSNVEAVGVYRILTLT